MSYELEVNTFTLLTDPVVAKVRSKHPHLLPQTCLDSPREARGERKGTVNRCFTLLY